MTAQKIDRLEAERIEIEAWNQIAPLRASDLNADRDPSYRYVLTPGILSILPSTAENVLDIGCGVGRLTKKLAAPSRTVTGIEPSRVSAEIASRHLKSSNRTTVAQSTIQEFAVGRVGGFDAAVALMVMQDVVDLDGFLKGTSAALRDAGTFVAAITHPVHWPAYWGYDKETWFDSEREIFISSEFRTSLTNSGIRTLHVHRPWSMYQTQLRECGFKRIETWEPMMPPRIQDRLGIAWNTPHFLFLRATK